jgi:hypothetical protein
MIPPPSSQYSKVYGVLGGSVVDYVEKIDRRVFLRRKWQPSPENSFCWLD